MFGSSSGPAAPDPAASAAAQAAANRVGVLSPTGSQYYGNFQPVARPENVTEADWNARPFDERYSFQVDPSHAVTQVVETPAQRTFRTGQEGLAQSLQGRATTQLGALPTAPLDFSGAPAAQNNIWAPQIQRTIESPGEYQRQIADAGPITREIDMSGIRDFQNAPIQGGVNFFGLQNIPGLGDFGGEAARAQEASFGRQLGLLEPQFRNQEEAQKQSLADRGIPVGSDAWKEATRQFDQNRQNALLSAAQDAINQGGAEQSRLFGLAMGARGQGVNERLSAMDAANRAQAQLFGQSSTQRGQEFGERATAAGFGNQAQAQQFGQNAAQMQAYNDALNQQLQAELSRAAFANQAAQQGFGNELTAAQFGNQARASNINEQMLKRGNSFNELSALLGGPQIGAPTALSPTPVDIVGPQQLQYQSQLAAANQRAAGLGGLFGLGGSVLGAGLMPGGIFRR